MSCAVEITRNTGNAAAAGAAKVRLLLGVFMLLAGFYFGLFSAGMSEGLGFLSMLAAPFVIIADK